jgi:hypothetical protein
MFDETFDPITETIDQHVESNHDAVTLVTADGPAIPGTSAFCVLYASARPVLHWVKAVLFFKPKWRALLTGLIAGLDAVCAGETEAVFAAVHADSVQPAVGVTGAAIDQKDESPQAE